MKINKKLEGNDLILDFIKFNHVPVTANIIKANKDKSIIATFFTPIKNEKLFVLIKSDSLNTDKFGYHASECEEVLDSKTLLANKKMNSKSKT